MRKGAIRRNKRKSKQDAKLPKAMDIAIVGMACRFPGANDYHQFWHNLSNGVNSVREITNDHWNIQQFYSPDANEPNKTNSKWAGLLDQIDKFDNHFFNISPREAERMDPQQRIFLEETWHCIEDSGIPLQELQQATTSVFIGIMATDYRQHFFNSKHITDSYDLIGNYETFFANRVSYFCNFSGMSIPIDGACASSLVTIHEARRSLLLGDSDYAIAAGVNIICHPWHYVSCTKSHMLSPDGQCKTFDSRANGFVAGEGVGVLLLEPLAKAIERRHHIYGVIKGSAVGHNGKGLSFTTPSIYRQREIIEKAHTNSSIDPQTITYVEAHGTGTSIGDPMEVAALTQAFHTNKKQYCALGSVKSNFGHLEAAAGVAGVIKVLLMMKHHKIAQTLNVKNINPMIDIKNSPFYIADKLTNWDLPDKLTVRRAGISSFGLGGGNAHVVIEEYEDLPKKISTEKKATIALPFLLSAKTKKSLDELVQGWLRYIQTEDFKQQSLLDISYNLRFGRETFEHRYGFAVTNKNDLIHELRSYQDSPHNYFHHKLDAKATTILRVNSFNVVDFLKFEKSCNQFPILKRLKVDLFSVLNKTKHGKTLLRKLRKNNENEIKNFIILFLLSTSMLRIKKKLNIQYLKGAGIAGISLAVSSGMLELKQAVQVLNGDFKKIILKRPSISFYDAVNERIIYPYQISKDYCQTLKDELCFDAEIENKLIEMTNSLYEHQLTFKKNLNEWVKYFDNHGIQLKSVLQKKQQLPLPSKTFLIIALIVSLKKLYNKWQIPETFNIKNNAANEIIDLIIDQAITPEWVEKLLLSKDDAVISDLVTHLNLHQNKIDSTKPYNLLKQFNRNLPEIENPGKWIRDLLTITNEESMILPLETKDLFYINIGNFQKPDKENIYLHACDLEAQLPQVLLALWLKYGVLNWRDWYPFEYYKAISLPTYCFDRERHWIVKEEKQLVEHKNVTQGTAIHSLIDVNGTSSGLLQYDKTLMGSEFYLNDHRVKDIKTLPGVVYLEMARMAAKVSYPNLFVVSLSNILWAAPIQVFDKPLHMTLQLDKQNAGLFYEVTTLADNKLEPEVHAQGTIILNEVKLQDRLPQLDISAIQSRCLKKLNKKEIYTTFNAVGLPYGPSFQVIENLAHDETELIAKLNLPHDLIDLTAEFTLHPSLMDGALQTCFSLLNTRNSTLYLPLSIGRIDIYNALTPTCYVHSIVVHSGAKGMTKFNIQIANAQGEILVAIYDFVLRPYKEKSINYFSSAWKNKTLQAPDKSSRPKKLLIFRHDHHSDNLLKEHIRDDKVIQVTLGDKFYFDNEYHYQINRQQLNSYDKLFTHLESINQFPQRILYHLNLSSLISLDDTDLKKSLADTIYAIFHLSKALILHKPKEAIELVIINTDDEELSRLFTMSLSGFVKSLHIEQPKITGRIINIDKGLTFTPSALFNELEEHEVEVKYDNKNIRWIKQYQEISLTDGLNHLPLRKNGIYLITGGLGGVGLIFARYLAEQYQANLILIGRSELQEHQKSIIDELKKLGAQIIYLRADVANRASLAKAFKEAKLHFSIINGVIHSAGIIRDSFILMKTPEQMSEVLMPKIAGVINLDEVTQAEPLDFFVLFSSIAAVFGNMGQSDYAYSNCFLDNYAVYRDSLKNQNKRSGKSLSINWSYWKEGGMKIDETTLQSMEKELGITPLTTKNGINAFLNALTHHYNQYIVLPGNHKKINDALDKTTSLSITKSKMDLINPNKQNSASIEIYTENYLRNLVADALHLTPEKLMLDEPFENYGVDSILIISLNQILTKTFGDISKTLFFEYPNLKTLTNYFIQNYYTKLHDLSSVKTPSLEPQHTLINVNSILENYKKAFINYDELSISLISIDNMNIEVVEGGKGDEVLLCLPPWGCLATAWRNQFAALLSNYKLISIHYPGCGRSDFKEDSIDFDKLAILVVNVLKKLNINKPVHLIGWSVGGIIAQYVNNRNPELIKTMTLVNSTAQFVNAYHSQHELMKAFKDDFDLSKNLTKLDLSLDQINGIYKPEVQTAYYGKPLSFDFNLLSTQRDIPCLLISGGRDKIMPENFIKPLYEKLSDAHFYLLPEAGHYIPLFYGNYFNDKLIRFLREVKIAK